MHVVTKLPILLFFFSLGHAFPASLFVLTLFVLLVSPLTVLIMNKIKLIHTHLVCIVSFTFDCSYYVPFPPTESLCLNSLAGSFSECYSLLLSEHATRKLSSGSYNTGGNKLSCVAIGSLPFDFVVQWSWAPVTIHYTCWLCLPWAMAPRNHIPSSNTVCLCSQSCSCIISLCYCSWTCTSSGYSLPAYR